LCIVAIVLERRVLAWVLLYDLATLMRKAGCLLDSDSALLATPATENREAICRDVLTLAAPHWEQTLAVHVFACFFGLGHGLSARGSGSLLSLDCRLSGCGFPFLHLRGPFACRLKLLFFGRF